jgi:hypothetical protein
MYQAARRSRAGGSPGERRIDRRRTLLVAVAVAGVAMGAAVIGPGAMASAAAPACPSVLVPGKWLPQYHPPLVSGDAEFGVHGPAITVSAKRLFWDFPRGSRDSVTVEVRMRAEETQPDWTTALGVGTFTLYTAPRSCNIDPTSLTLGDFDSNGYLARQNDTNPHLLDPGDMAEVNAGFVSGYRIWDRRSGLDVGSYASVQVRTRPFTVKFTN